MERLEILPTPRIATSHMVPGSKSYTNRALTIAALARGASILWGALVSDDTRVAREALAPLGISVDQAGTTLHVQGQQGCFTDPGQAIYLGNSGTATRFFTAMLTLADFPCTVTGNARMQQRPIADLIEALCQLGAEAVSLLGNGCPPVRIGTRRLRGGTATISGAISSQFLSALLMIAPYAREDVTLEVRDTLVSTPYVDMTLDIMKQFGVQMEHEHYRRFVISGQQCYVGQEYAIEGDASAATYFWGLAALLGQEMCVANIPHTSAQADLLF
jgi:3-phosphoshikimate 1-carboxyvinyltransferase